MEQKDFFELPTSDTWQDELFHKLSITQTPGWPDQFGSALKSWFSSTNTKKIPTLSLFSGGGGLDIGFDDANFEILEQVEVDPRYAETLIVNAQGKTTINCIDIRNYRPKDNLKVDMIIGGPPCQTFSAAGRRASGVTGTSDPRGTLFEEYVRILNQLQPKAFLFENVLGILSAEKGSAWKQIKKSFEKAGYQIFWRVLDTADYGVPQHRERVFIVGLKSGEFRFPRPTHGPNANIQYYTAGLAIENCNLIEDKNKLKINGKWGHLINDIPSGLNYSFYTAEMGHPKPVFAWRSKFSDFMYKADPVTPIKTLKANGGQYTGPFSWENRQFDISELKRLQTIPDHYLLQGTRSAQIQQIGNSVPPQVARILAMAVLDQIFEIPLPSSISYLKENEVLSLGKRKSLLKNIYAMKAKEAISQIDLNNTSTLQNDLFYNQITLTPNFQLHEGFNSNGVTAELTYTVDNDILTIKGDFSNKSSGAIFSVILTPNHNKTWAVPFKGINLIGHGDNIFHITILWKALEYYLLKVFGIADFVQLSGYYQYHPKVKAELNHNQTNPTWNILKEIISYNGVGKHTTLSELSNLWDISENNIHKELIKIREIGYEIRNHNTNNQIPKGKYLIPYFFPSLNPPSLQRFKSL